MGLTRYMAFNSCLLHMGRGQEHLEKVDEKLVNKFKVIRLEGIAPQSLTCHVNHNEKSHCINSPQTIKAEKKLFDFFL